MPLVGSFPVEPPAAMSGRVVVVVVVVIVAAAAAAAVVRGVAVEGSVTITTGRNALNQISKHH